MGQEQHKKWQHSRPHHVKYILLKALEMGQIVCFLLLLTHTHSTSALENSHLATEFGVQLLTTMIEMAYGVTVWVCYDYHDFVIT